METAIETIPEPVPDTTKVNEENKETISTQESACHKSNGAADSDSVVQPEQDISGSVIENKDCNDHSSINEDLIEVATDLTHDTETLSADETKTDTEVNLPIVETTEKLVEHDIPEVNIEPAENVDNIYPNIINQINNIQTEEILVDDRNETNSNESVKFETEVLVETNDNDINEVEVTDNKTEDNDTASNILSELGQSIELSEALRSSDVTENLENNNCTVRQEVFNKEELLDILEGNDDQVSEQEVSKLLQYNHNADKALETKLALQQLSRLKSSKNRTRSKKKNLTKKSEKIVFKKGKIIKKEIKKEEIQKKENHKEESIVNALVKDWDDEEPIDEQKPKETEPLSKTIEEIENNCDDEKRTSIDSATSDGQTIALNKSSDESQPQRRLGRVIKKKVIFDPDNPDTFTKGKAYIKNKDTPNEKEQPPVKKCKIEQTTIRAKSKSPVSKMQWKKPSPKNNKQNKRLSEVDKLLMDEGAVNMIYQLTPEAPKGKKNMRTKAEFIKKIQSSTPEGKEMKFRERKKETGKEEGEPKKILSGKQRSSLGGSIKSSSACEDFETHSADDSIIYRRHSSSSYSSSCMSPRRLSDVDTGANQTVVTSQPATEDIKPSLEGENGRAEGVFEYDVPLISNEIINKDDCLTIKKKLNSKLSLALNKRKRDCSKTEKPTKKHLKTDNVQKSADSYKLLTIRFDERVAFINILKTGSKYNIEILKELAEALTCINNRKDISTTLLTSDCGALCSDLDLKELLDGDVQQRIKIATHVAETVRSLLWTVAQHTKLFCSGVWSACSGVALALVALSDIAFAAENATFALANQTYAATPLFPGVSAVLASCQPHSQSLINDLVIFDRSLSASEAVQNGLVSRVLWTGGFSDQVNTIVKDIASQPLQKILLKKKLLNMRKGPEDTFLAQLETERDLMVEYWTSDEGQEIIRAYNQDT